jgi:hypothetical protein
MPVNNNRKTKKSRGRPATGVDPMVNFRLSTELIAQLDEWAEENGLNRSQALRRLVESGLKAKN